MDDDGGAGHNPCKYIDGQTLRRGGEEVDGGRGK